MFAEAFADEEALVCYAMKANSNQAVLRTLARPGAGMDVVSGGELHRALAAGVPPREDRLLGRRQDRGRDGRRAGRGHPLLQCRIRARARAAVAARGRPGRHGADLDPRESRRRCRHPRQNLDRQVREQVRHSDQPRARGLCPRRDAAGPRRDRRRHAYRQPDHRSRALRRRVPAARRTRADAARRGHPISHVDFGGGLGIPYRGTTPRRRTRPPMRRWSSAHAPLGCKLSSSPAG